MLRQAQHDIRVVTWGLAVSPYLGLGGVTLSLSKGEASGMRAHRINGFSYTAQ